MEFCIFGWHSDRATVNIVYFKKLFARGDFLFIAVLSVYWYSIANNF